MNLSPKRLFIVALFLGWLFDFLFWKQAPGLNFALFALLSLLAGFALLLSAGLRPARTTLLLLPPFAFLALMTFIRQEPLTSFVNYLLTLLLMSLVAVTYLGGRWWEYSFLDYLRNFLRLAGSLFFRPWGWIGQLSGDPTESPAAKRRWLWPLVRGVLLALPIVVVFASLLASADLVFNQRLQSFINLFNLQNLPEYLFRLGYILAAAYALSGVYLHAASQSSDEFLADKTRPLIPPFLGFVEASVVLGSVVLLFASFVLIQFQYFFGGQANIHLDGFTYSEYARRGFGELVAVAFFSLLLLFVLAAITRRQSELQRRIFSALASGMVALVLVILASAYQRLSLYEAAYGFSRLRTYTHVFLVWLGLLLMATIVLEILRKERAFPLSILITALGFAVSLNLLNVDAFIVQRNIARTLEDRKVALDTPYFLTLSDDAIPPLSAALQTPTLPDTVKEALTATLVCFRAQRTPADSYPWPSFHFARLAADRALQRLQPVLEQYQLLTTNGEWTVTSPAGNTYPCSPAYAD